MLPAVLPNPKDWDPRNELDLTKAQQRILQRELDVNFPEKLLR